MDIKTHHRKIVISILFGIIAASVILSMWMLRDLAKIPGYRRSPNLFTYSPPPHQAGSTTYQPPPTPSPYPKMTIATVQNNTIKTVYEFPADKYQQEQSRPLRWGDFLVIPKLYGEPNVVSGINIHSLIETTLFESATPNFLIGNVAIVNNELYVAGTEYISERPIYRIPSPLAAPIELTKAHNGSFKKIGANWFIVEGDGDGCGGYQQYSLYNPITHTSTFVGKSNEGCSYGAEYQGLTSNGLMLFVNHDQFESIEPPIKNADIQGIYTDIFALAPTNPQTKIVMIDKAHMPPRVTDVEYDEAHNALYLSSDVALYQYIPGSASAIKLSDISADLEINNGSISHYDNALCFTAGQNAIVTFDLAKKQFDYNGSCNAHYNQKETESYGEYFSAANKIFKDLNLPDNFYFYIEK